MTIRIEVKTEAVCEECEYRWTPTSYMSGDTIKSFGLECPRCADERQEAGRIMHVWPDDVVNLLG